MEEINWLYVVIALVSGGAMGAIINAIVSALRARVQPVGRRIEILPIFSASGGDTSLRAKVSITHEGSTRTFKNLFVAEVVVVNRGNRDLERFEFGATFADGDKCIHVEASPPDRHHRVTQDAHATPQAPSHELDFALQPFNRRDCYTFKMYIVVPEEKEKPGKITLGSPSPIRFIEMPTMSEVLATSLGVAAVQVGPLVIRIGR